MALASLPMYDLPELRWATDALWTVVRAHLRRRGLRPLPRHLVRGVSVRGQWSTPGLLLSQCCGYDLVYGFAGALQALATPCYSAPGCEGGHYRSVVLVRSDSPATTLTELRGARCVVNGFGSHSGTNALRALVAPLSRGARFFGEVRVSGGHLASLAMLAENAADVAALDCVLHALLARHRPAALAGTRVLCWTEAAPAPPFVTTAEADGTTCAKLRAGLLAALADPRAQTPCEMLLLTGATVLPPSAYARILDFEAAALSRRYVELHAPLAGLDRAAAAADHDRHSGVFRRPTEGRT